MLSLHRYIQRDKVVEGVEMLRQSYEAYVQEDRRTAQPALICCDCHVLMILRMEV
jgi:hypothetical protein